MGFRISSLAVAHEVCLVESRWPLWFGSSQANRSVHSLLAAVSRSTLIICLRLASHASLSHRFQVPVTLAPTVQLFHMSSCLLTSLVQQWFTLTNMQYGNIVSRTNGAGCRYTESRTYSTYIHIENSPANSPVWGERERAPTSTVSGAVPVIWHHSYNYHHHTEVHRQQTSCDFSVHIIGASLSKPYASVTALHMHVCMLAWTDHLS